MRPLPRYWARHRGIVTVPGTGELDLTMTGHSSLSQDDAQREARERFDRIVAQGGPRAWSADREYYPDRFRPEQLLEEVHAPGGELIAALTRNRYGAVVLNTDGVLITDIDLPAAQEQARPRSGRGRGGGFFSRLLGREPGDDPDSAPPDGEDPDRLGLRGPGARGDDHERILQAIGRFCADHPELGVRTYRTRNGFRVLLLGADASPRSDRAGTLMDELGSDELYTRLCRVHETYRARLTPKPWRIGIRRPLSGPLEAAQQGWAADWIERYDAASQPVAVCRFIGDSGPAPDPVEQQIIELHDRAVKAGSGLPLA